MSKSASWIVAGLVAIAIAIGMAGPARAVPLGVRATLSILVPDAQGNSLEGAVQSDGYGSAIVNGLGPFGHISSLSVESGLFSTAGLMLPAYTFSFPNRPLASLQLTVANASGAFAGAPLGGVMPLLGVAKICFFAACSAAAFNVVVPLSVVGAGGTAVVQQTGGPITGATVIGAPWTTGTAVVGSFTAMGGVAPASFTGAPRGRVTLVTPIFVSTALTVVPMLGTMELVFAPEPGTLVLLGVGIAGLVVFGRSARERS